MDKLIVAYGTENITINKGDQYISLSKEEASRLLKSLLNNMKIIGIELK